MKELIKQIFTKESFYFSYSKKSFLTLPLFILISFSFVGQLTVPGTTTSFIGIIYVIGLYVGIYLAIPKIWLNIKDKTVLKMVCTLTLYLVYFCLLSFSTLL